MFFFLAFSLIISKIEISSLVFILIILRLKNFSLAFIFIILRIEIFSLALTSIILGKEFLYSIFILTISKIIIFFVICY